MTTVAWRAPGRVNLIGEHTDYNGGFALPLAIGQACVAQVSTTDDRVLRMRSAQEDAVAEIALDDLAPGAVDGWAAYVAGVVWAIADRMDVDTLPGLDVRVDSDVPVGAGLSSSAALACSVAGAVGDVLGLELSPTDLVQLSRAAENDFVGAPTGGMDQLASVCAQERHALLCDMSDLSTRSVGMDLEAAGLALLVIDTGAPHAHADGEYGARRASCQQAADLLGVPSLRDVQDLDHAEVLARLAAAADGADAADRADADVLVRRVRHVLTENDRVLAVAAMLDEGRLGDIGPLLSRSQESMRVDYEITVATVDTAAESAERAGALGARMTGGGFGGCVIALVPLDRVAAVREAVRDAFHAAGFDAASFFTTTPHAGAVRTEATGPG